MSYLINLPTIEKIKKDAEKYRNIVNSDYIKEKEDKKHKIMQEFNKYMDAELKGNPRLSL